MKTGNIILGLMAGIATGTLLGILFAPDKGSVTRKRIFSMEDNYTDTLKIEFDELVGAILCKFECTRQEAEELVAAGETEFIKSTDFLKKDI